MIHTIRLLWILSCLFFLASDAFCYLKLPNNFNLFDYILTRKFFFYIMLTVVVLFNFLIILMSNTSHLIPKSWLFIPKKNIWLSINYRKQLYIWLDIFFGGLAFLGNLFLMVFMGWFLFEYMDWEKDNFDGEIALKIFVILIGCGFVGWIIYIFFKLNYPKISNNV